MTGRARPDEPLATWCEARLDCCTGRAVTRHHRKYRSRGGSDAAANTVDICAPCHRRVHAEVAWSTKAGLSVSRHSPEPTEPWTARQLEDF